MSNNRRGRHCRGAAWGGLAAAACLMLAGSGSRQDQQPLRWPLDVPLNLRSSFGEYRAGGRVHGGVDLSTGGRTGLPVRAAADGQIFRLKVEWRGYGNAIYQRLEDGRILLYAHLEAFVAPGLEQAVARARRRGGRYPGNVPVSPAVSVRRGDILALSGESGAGFPHLHFEVRLPGNLPSDPLSHDIVPAVHDRAPPVFEGVWLFARAPGSWVGGPAWQRRWVARRRAGAAWEAGPVRVAGPVDLVVEAYDPAPDDGRLGISEIRVWWDRREVGRSRIGPYRFDELRQIAGVHDTVLSRLSPTRFAYRPLAHARSAWAPAEGAGGLDGLPGTRHLLEVEIGDASGNTARLKMAVRFVRAELLVRPLDPSDGKTLAPARAFCLDPVSALWLPGHMALRASGPGAECRGTGAQLRLLDGSGRGLEARLWSAADPKAVEPAGLLVARLPEDGEIVFALPGPGRSYCARQKRMGSAPLVVSCGDARVRFAAAAFPAEMPVTLQEVPSARPQAGLLPGGMAVRIEPAWKTPVSPVRLQLGFDAVDHRARRLGIYRWSRERERWLHEGGTGEARQGSLEVKLGELGTFRLLEDAVPPEWGDVQPAGNARLPPTGWKLRIEVSDAGSGIDWDGVKISLDERPLESEYDPDRNWAIAWPARPLEVGVHRVRALARDRAGNESSLLEWKFRVVQSR